MKNLHYGSLVFSISDQLADTIERAAVAFMDAGRSAVWPVACYRDERDEISVQIVFGPGIPFAITSPWLTDEGRPDPRYSVDSVKYIEDELDSLERDLEDNDR